MTRPLLVPELDVSDLSTSLHFYVELAGFKVLYERPEERFAFLTLDGVELMLQEANGPGRRFRTAPLQRPFGRGVNFQIEVTAAAKLAERFESAGFEIVLALEEKWYRVADHTAGQLQFVVADPDGYLLRFAERLAEHPFSTS